MIGRTLLNFRIIEKLGAGGQGEVYKAVDTSLDRRVVVKILSPELTASEAGLRRFEREARLASSLDHPNICTIFGLHEADGLRFITMQLVEGRNVRQLVRGRPLEVRPALSVAYQTTDALAAAHSRGIIHRDVKAGNVMVTSAGLVKVLDFGLAKLQGEAAEDAHRTDLTEIGVPYGTATYAAPEQARGDRVDHRADIFSAGVLLYEMLTGTWPFRGKTNVDVRHAVLHDAPKPLIDFRRDLPPRLAQVIDRAIAKDPRDRYQKMSDLRDELRAALRELDAEASDDALAVPPRHLSSTGGLGHTLRRWLRAARGGERAAVAEPASSPQTSRPSAARDAHQSGAGEAPKRSVAVLPFRNLSDDPAVSFYEFSLADAVITELARLRSLVVRPSSLMAKYQSRQADPLAAGRELDVTAVLAASFLTASGRLRVNAQLLDVRSGALLWSERIDAEARDFIAVQDAITQHIVEGLRVELSADEQVALERRPSVRADAYEEYLRGRDRLARYAYRSPAREEFDAAVAHFRRAVSLDPSFAPAHSGLGVCHTTRVFAKLGGASDYELAERAFRRALELDPRLLEARLHMVFIYLARGEKPRARVEVERLLGEAPNDAAVHRVAANLFRLDGRREEALRHFARAARLNPEERVHSCYQRARILVSSRREEEALRELDEASAAEPGHPLIKTFRAFLLYYRGDLAGASALVREVLDAHPEMDSVRPLLAMCLSRRGRHAEARAELSERVHVSAAADPDIAYWLASAYALEAMRDEAFEWLGRAITLGREDRGWFEADPDWSNLRDDPRFAELMRRIQPEGDPSASDF